MQYRTQAFALQRLTVQLWEDLPFPFLDGNLRSVGRDVGGLDDLAPTVQFRLRIGPQFLRSAERGDGRQHAIDPVGRNLVLLDQVQQRLGDDEGDYYRGTFSAATSS